MRIKGLKKFSLRKLGAKTKVSRIGVLTSGPLSYIIIVLQKTFTGATTLTILVPIFTSREGQPFSRP